MASSIPGAKANLAALITAAFVDQTNVNIHVGAKLGVFVAPQTIQITGVTGDQEPAELGPSYRREETFQIHMEIDSWAGDDDFATREVEVMDLFETISLLVANNYRLPAVAGNNDIDGTVRFAEVGTFTLTSGPLPTGQSCGTLTFMVHCSQRITSLT